MVTPEARFPERVYEVGAVTAPAQLAAAAGLTKLSITGATQP